MYESHGSWSWTDPNVASQYASLKPSNSLSIQPPPATPPPMRITPTQDEGPVKGTRK